MAQADDPRYRYRTERDRLDRAEANGELDAADADAIREVLDALDAERQAKVFQVNGSTETKSNGTLRNYAQRLRLAAVAIEGSLLDQTTYSVRELMDDLGDGTHDLAPDGGYAANTLGQYQSALKAFYRYHDGHAVNPEAIPVSASNGSTIDERDMFTADEVAAMREAIDHPRERCLFELLVYTGQRLRVIQTLRVKDVDPAEGVFWINAEADGRKGAEGKRPLLGAREFVYQWLDYHPTGEPEDYLLTAIPSHGGGGQPGEMLSQSTIRYHLGKIAAEAGVDKDIHPHVFRHYFTTIAKRDYGMDDQHIRRLRGDAPGSNVMETTYSHLSDDDSIQHAEEKAGFREPVEDPRTPETCPTCKKQLEPTAKACNRCGTIFATDAVAAKEQMEEDVREDKDQIDDLETYRLVDRLEKLKEDHPELIAELLEA